MEPLELYLHILEGVLPGINEFPKWKNPPYLWTENVRSDIYQHLIGSN